MTQVAKGDADVAVRINSGMALAAADLEAAIRPGVGTVVVTKVRGPDHIALVAELIDELEARAGMAAGHTRPLLLIETPDALAQAAAIGKASARAVAMALGGEDFAASIGAEASEQALLLPKQMALYAARATGLSPSA